MKKLLLLACLLWTTSAFAQAIGTAKYTTMATVAYGSVTASYTAFLTSVKPLKQVDILNTTNCDVTISFDASTAHYFVPKYSSLVLNFRQLEVEERHSVSGKSAGSCTVGSVYVSGIY